MKKVIKSYIKKICSRALISDIKIEEVKSKETELFLNDNIVQAIRFYDIDMIKEVNKGTLFRKIDFRCQEINILSSLI